MAAGDSRVDSNTRPGAAALAVALLSLLAFTGTLAVRSTIPLMSFYARSVLGVAALGVGGMTAAFYLVRAGAAVGTGYASSRPLRAGLVASAAFAGHVGVILYLSTGPGYAGLLLVRGLQGVLNGLAWTSAQILLAMAVPPRWRGRAYAVYGISGSLGAMGGDLLYSALGTRVLGYAAALAAVSSAVATASGLALRGAPGLRAGGSRGSTGRGRAGPGGRRGRARGWSGGLGTAALLVLMAAVSYISVMGIGDIAYIYYREVLGISRSEAAALRGVAGFLGTVAGYGLGWLADVGGSELALAAAYAAAAAGALAIPVPSIYVAGLGIALMTAAGRAFMPAARKVASEMPRGNVMLGYLGAASNIASAAGALAYGYAYTALGLEQVGVDGLRVILAPVAAALWALVVPPALLAFYWLRRK